MRLRLSLILIGILLSIIVITILYGFLGKREHIQEAIVLRINDVRLIVEVADTPAKRAKGLSGRKDLGSSQGMLFLFEHPGMYSFWMRDMHFPIDVIWIDEHHRVVAIDHNVQPNSFPHRTFTPPKPVPYVLEIAAGLIKDPINIGEKIFFTLSP